MNQDDQHFLVLDIGTTNVRALIGRSSAQGRLDVLSVSKSAGDVSAMHAPIQQADCVRAIKNAVGQASAQANVHIHEVWISLPSNWVSMQDGRGEVLLKRGEIRRQDMNAVLENARLPFLSPTRRVLHQCNLQAIVDGRVVQEPYMGERGQRLVANTKLMVCSHQHLKHVVETVKLAGLKPRGILLETLAAASATLHAHEMEEGVLLVELGAHKTSLGFWKDGQVRDVACLETGGLSFSEELASSLRIPMPAAVRLQETCSCICSAHRANESPIDVTLEDGGKRSVTPLAVAQILEPRVLELFSEIREEIQQRGYDQEIRYVVFTGGGVWMQGFQELAENYAIFHPYQIRLGLPRGIASGAELVSQTRYATLVGLLKEAAADQQLRIFYTTEEEGVGTQVKKIVGKFIDNFF